MLTITIVIPVYNEERHIKSCLDAISAQTLMPDEVIVVDNNCTDATIDIAKEYPFVKVVKEKKQGLIAARNAGVNAATSDIIGRIDGHSVIDHSWVETVLTYFHKNEHVAAISGLARTPMLPAVRSVTGTFLSRMYYAFADSYFGVPILWGSNMAIRRSVYLSLVEEFSSEDDKVHEDQDISCVVHAHGLEIGRTNTMLISVVDQASIDLDKLWHYDYLRKSTKRLHKDSLPKRALHRVFVSAVIQGVYYPYFVALGIITKIIRIILTK